MRAGSCYLIWFFGFRHTGSVAQVRSLARLKAGPDLTTPAIRGKRQKKKPVTRLLIQSAPGLAARAV